MKAIINWMLAAIFICGASVFTSCTNSIGDNPVIVVNSPTITIQPISVTYTTGDTTYPKMSVAAIASAGALSYEWFVNTSFGIRL